MLYCCLLVEWNMFIWSKCSWFVESWSRFCVTTIVHYLQYASLVCFNLFSLLQCRNCEFLFALLFLIVSFLFGVSRLKIKFFVYFEYLSEYMQFYVVLKSFRIAICGMVVFNGTKCFITLLNVVPGPVLMTFFCDFFHLIDAVTWRMSSTFLWWRFRFEFDFSIFDNF